MSYFSDKSLAKMRSVLATMRTNGEMQIPDSQTPIDLCPDALLTFVTFGDPQVSNYMFARQKCFCSACLDLQNMTEDLDALILAGDIAENGMQCEYDLVADILNETSGHIQNILCVPGNHDTRLRPHQKQVRKFRSFTESVKKCVSPEPGHFYHKAVIKGYTFLMLGPDAASFEGSYLSQKQLQWLDNELSKACGKGKPVFVVNHQTLRRHNGLPHTWIGFGSWRGSVGWQSDALRNIFEKYEDVFLITGHLHFGTCAYTFEDHGKYKTLGVQTVGAGNHGDYTEDSQGYVVQVFKDKIVLRARLFGKGCYVPEDIPCAKVEIKL